MSGLTWAGLEYSLGRHVKTMSDEDLFMLCVDESGRPRFDPDLDDYPRYVQFYGHGAGRIRCEVVSNTYLPDDMRHSVDDLIAMRLDGWMLPQDEHISGSPNLYLDVRTSDPWRAAGMTMNVFRHIWHVSDPDGIVCDADDLRGPRPFVPREAPSGFRTSAPLH